MSVLAVAVRSVHLGTAVLLLGIFCALLLVMEPAARAVGDARPPALVRLERVLRRLALACLTVLALSAATWLWIHAVTVTGGGPAQVLTLDTARSVLLETTFGRVWLLRLALIVVLAAFCL